MFITQCRITCTGMKIDQRQEPGYECVSISHVGLVDPHGVEGVVVLGADDGSEFPIRAFSGEVAKYIKEFIDGEQKGLPSIYKMVEEICENGGIFLVKIKIYESGQVLRANLYFTGKNEMILRNYRASDAIALAAYYKSPILIRDVLLKEGLN